VPGIRFCTAFLEIVEKMLDERHERAVKVTGGHVELEPLKSVLESCKAFSFKSLFNVSYLSDII
jgi:hypothetical protein